MSKTIFTNGVFDGGLHVGHCNLLIYCRMLAGPDGKVIVGLDSDEKVCKDKGQNRPIFDWKVRKFSILSLCDGDDFAGADPCEMSMQSQIVDEVFSFNTNEELYELVKTVKPDIIVKGSEYINLVSEKNKNVIGSDLAKVVYFTEYNKSKISTTNIINSAVNKTLEFDFRNEVVDPFERP